MSPYRPTLLRGRCPPRTSGRPPRVLHKVAGYLQGKACLARASHPSEREKSCRLQLSLDLYKLALAAYEAASCGR
jgi:hypothetical protein